MWDSLKHRDTWGKPVFIDPLILDHADDVYPHSRLFEAESLAFYNKKTGWEDNGHVSVDFFIRRLTDQNVKNSIYLEDEYVPLRNQFYSVTQPTIGELAFVIARCNYVLNSWVLPNWGDDTDVFAEWILQAREMFPKHEALAWAFLQFGKVDNRLNPPHTLLSDLASDVFQKNMNTIREHDIRFDDAARFIQSGIIDGATMKKILDNDLDPQYFTD